MVFSEYMNFKQIAYLTALFKGQLFWNVFLVSSILPKKNKNNSTWSQSCFVSKETTDVRVTKGMLCPTKYNNVGTFERICVWI
jgi:hypothetical protein